MRRAITWQYIEQELAASLKQLGQEDISLLVAIQNPLCHADDGTSVHFKLSQGLGFAVQGLGLVIIHEMSRVEEGLVLDASVIRGFDSKSQIPKKT